MLPLKGKTVLHHVLVGFSKYFNQEKIVFILIDNEFEPKSFVKKVVSGLGIEKFEIVVLRENTRGQAETVFKGLEQVNPASNESVTIFNVDTFRPHFAYPDFLLVEQCSYLETFIGSGKNWSNVVPVSEGSPYVARALEKQEASQYCCTGLYHWKNYAEFKSAYLDYELDFPDKELYVAPMYNYSIQKNNKVRYTVVATNEVIFCGTPEEYEYLLANS